MAEELAGPEYTPRQVTMALQALARNHGDVEATANLLINDEFMVSAAQLVEWRTELHVEQYDRISNSLGAELERAAVQQAHRIIVRTGELQLEMIERVGELKQPALVAGALRALTDAKRKGVNDILLLTGRSVTGAGDAATVEAMTRLVSSLEGLGLIKVSPSIAPSLTVPSEDVTEIKDDTP